MRSYRLARRDESDLEDIGVTPKALGRQSRRKRKSSGHVIEIIRILHVSMDVELHL
ncbi:hypothetical protein [Dyadobacter fermentans]|uniref:hypothetical protein n=1 Tax=Dyadobacter fermentans TaxID=94254 RepID=UPI001651A195|nr:hypothetical protein [Dyadobacter fermentans]